MPRRLAFQDEASALTRLAHIEQIVPAGVYESLSALLLASPNPDAVVNQFERLAETASPELLAQLNKHASLVHYAMVVFGHSLWLGETLIHNHDLFYSLMRDRNLDRSLSREEFRENFGRMRSRSFETDTASLLARFKRREYVRIMLRDVLSIATLAETTAEISALADVLIEEALQDAQAQMQHRFGSPQWMSAQGRVMDSRFAVVSLGKLGGNELNYSSDIDLLFLYDSGEEVAGADISNREYFIRLAQQVTELLARHTREGPVFRIDLRLRPQGGEGEPAVPLSHARQYYSRVAQDWELQAMIKARHSAGDVGLAREFLTAVQPYVYRPELNFAAIKTALVTREKIGSHRRRGLLKEVRQSGVDVKIDQGGIRDIEFLVQCLQRIYGGAESWLRSRGTMFALQKLHDKEHISGKDFHNLTDAYGFLRNVEHRLQLRQGQQIHRLPQGRHELEVLARSMSREGAVVMSAEEFVADVQRRMAAVAEIYQRVIYREQSQEQGAEFQLWPQSAATPENTYSQMLQRLAVDSPQLREIALRTDLSQHARRNLDRFLSSAGTTSERYGAVLRSAAAVEQALEIFEYSEFLTDILVRYPEEVSLLEEIDAADARREHDLFADAAAGEATGDSVFEYLSRGQVDHGEAMSILRRHYRRRVFLSGAMDLFYAREIFDSLHQNTASADSAIQAAYAIAGSPAGFAVLGLGRLGSHEFDLLSDADVLFVCDDNSDREVVRRAAERFMETLTAYTRDGTVFSVDLRLRPHGREGEIVVTPSQLEAYFKDEAKPWEALTYLKLRHVAGDAELTERAGEVVRRGIAVIGERPGFVAELADVRTRLERSETGANLKTGPGGIYDLDYVVGSLQVQHQLWLAGDLLQRLEMLRQHSVLSQDELGILAENARLLRAVEHVIRLVTGRARKWLPVSDHPRRAAQKRLWRTVSADDSFDSEMRLTELMRQTREIYSRYLLTT